MSPFLSGCLIVKNEAENLARCLSSIKPYIDELVVVDTGSTDETVAIAKEFGATIHHFDWCDDFAAARNFAIEQVQGDWIIMLDADEELIVQEQDWLCQLAKRSNEIYFTIELYASEGNATVFPAIRIFRNHHQLKYRGRYHEQLTWCNEAVMVTPPLHGIHLVHYGYLPHILQQKSEVRIRMLQKLREEEELSLLLLWSLMGMYLRRKQLDDAQSCYEEASERLFESLLLGEKPKDFRSVPSWLHTLGEDCLKTEDYEGLRLICLQGLEWCPTFPPFSYLTGMLVKGLGLELGAIPYFQRCIEFGESGNFYKNEPFDQKLLTVLPHYQLGCLHRKLSNTNLAIEHFSACLLHDPNFANVRAQLQEIQTIT